MIQTSRRSLITGLISLIAAPAVVRAASLMPVKALPAEPQHMLRYLGYDIYFDQHDPAVVNLIVARIEDAEKAMYSWMEHRIYDTASSGLTNTTL